MFSPCFREVIATEPASCGPPRPRGFGSIRRCSPRRCHPKIPFGLVVRDGTDRSCKNSRVSFFLFISRRRKVSRARRFFGPRLPALAGSKAGRSSQHFSPPATVRSSHQSNFAKSLGCNPSRFRLRDVGRAPGPDQEPDQFAGPGVSVLLERRRGLPQMAALHIACLATFFSRPNTARNDRAPRFRGSPRARPRARDRPAGRTAARCRSRDPLELACDPQARLVRILGAASAALPGSSSPGRETSRRSA